MKGHKRMKHKHSRNSKPQGESPLHHATAPGLWEAGSCLLATPTLSASEATRLLCPLQWVCLDRHRPSSSPETGVHQSGTGVADGALAY